MQSYAAGITTSDNTAPTQQGNTYEARITRQLPRNIRYNHSAASSTGSNHGTVSPDNTWNTHDTLDTDFDPIRDEAANSTGIFPPGVDPTDPEVHRAKLRTMKGIRFSQTTKTRSNRFATKKTLDFGMANSAMNNVFADFSSGPLQVETFSNSLEVGRGPENQKPASTSSNITANAAGQNRFSSNSKQSSNPYIIDQVKDQNVFHTPKKAQPTQAKSTILQDALRNVAAHNDHSPSIHDIIVEQKENVPPSIQKSTTRRSYISNTSRAFTGERRSLAELQPHVTDGSHDGSMIADERPSNVTFQTKSNRFLKVEPRASQPDPQLRAQIFTKKETTRAAENVPLPQPRLEPAQALSKAVENAQRLRSNSQGTPNRPSSKAAVNNATNVTIASTTGNPTQKSFIIHPQSEPTQTGTATTTIVDGVPVQVRAGRVQDRKKPRRNKPHHSGVDDMDADLEEEDLYEMLDESRNKNSELEMLLRTAQSTILKLENEKKQLALDKEHLQTRQRSDSALGESDGEGSKKQKLVETEMIRLTSEAASLQSLLDKSQRTVSNQELLLKTKGADCEQALKQAAQCNGLVQSLRQENESLGTENMALKDEVEDLNAQLAQIAAESDCLDSENMSLRAENDDLNNQLAQLLAERGSLNQRNADLEEEYQDLKTQLDRVMEERNELTHNSKSKNTSVEQQLNQLTVERRQASLNNQKLKTDIKNQLHELLRQNSENKHIWETKETALLNKLRRQENVIRVLQDRSNQIMETTNRLDIKVPQKSSSSRSAKPKSVLRTNTVTADIPSSVTKQGQQDINEIKVGITVKNGCQSSALLQKAQNPPAANSSNTVVSNHDESFGDNIIEIRPVDSNITQDTFNGSNYSDELGHGYMENMRRKGRELRILEAQYDDVMAEEDTQDVTGQTVQSGRNSRAASLRPTTQQSARDDTIQSIQSATSSMTPSDKGFDGVLQGGEPQSREDFTGHLSVKSVKSNHDGVSGINLRRHSQIEQSHAITSNISHRQYSDISVHATGRRRKEAEDITSALLVDDIIAAEQDGISKDHPVLSTDARRVLDGLCKHNCKNCTICARLAAFESKTVKIHRPVPVSERMPVYEDEPTLRPSVSPGEALATVIKGLEDEVAHMKMKYVGMQEVYMKHDVSLGKRQRKTLKEALSNLLVDIERKSEQVYALYDVLEGQKQSGQEMTKDDLDVTLSKFGVQLEEAPWEGIVDDE